MKALKLISIFLVGAAIATIASAAPVLVGNSALSGISLNDSELEAVLLGKTISINGQRVVIVLAKSSDSQDAFLKSKIGKTTSQFSNHWRRLFMTGGGSSPKNVSTEADIAAKVSSTTGAIGIVDESQAGDLPILAR